MIENKGFADRQLILRLFLGATVMMWGYEKLVVDKLSKAYVLDYGSFMLIPVSVFLQAAGWLQIVMGALVILGLFTRAQALIFTFMGLITIIIPGMIILKDVPHFAYAFAFTGAAIVLWMDGGGAFSLDRWLKKQPIRLLEAPNKTGRSSNYA